MSYHTYWQLARLPFAGNGRGGDFFGGSSQREAIARLQFLVGNDRAAGLLIGPAGTGRTTVLRYAKEFTSWTGAVVEPLLLTGASDDTKAFHRQIASAMGVETSTTDGQLWRGLCDALDSSSRQEVQTLLLVDDATPAIAQAIAGLLNRSNRLTTVLACTPDNAAELASEVGGCPLRIDLAPWGLEDSANFLRESVIKAGGRQEIFSDAAIVRLHELSDGRVATLARLGELALLAGAGGRAPQISSDLVEAIQEEALYAA